MTQEGLFTQTFDQLDADKQERILAKFRDVNVNHDWSEYVIEDAKEIGKLAGIDIRRVYWSGFSSQGDGACFEGSYAYVRGAYRAVEKHAPEDRRLLVIMSDLAREQRRHFYKLTADVQRRGYYYNSHCTDIDVKCDGVEVSIETHNNIALGLRSFMDWIYARLNEEYAYLTSDEQVREWIDANECLFDLDGEILV